MTDMDILSSLDREALACYCAAFARWKKMETFLTKHGEVYTVKDDSRSILSVRVFPQFLMWKQSREILSKLEGSFGLTPADRVGLVTNNTNDDTNDQQQGKERFLRIG